METKVVVGLPHLGDLPGYFVDSMIHLASQRPGVASIIRIENKPTDVARSMVAKRFLEDPTNTHLLFLDADMIFPAQTVSRLLSWDVPVVGGTYFARTETPIPHIYRFNSVNADGVSLWNSLGKEMADWTRRHPEFQANGRTHIYTKTNDSLIPVDALATGCLLIKREVLEAMEQPYFSFTPGISGGEDFRFCARAKELGFDVYADLGLQCAHEAQMAFVGVHEFVEAFGVGQPEEVDFNQPFLVELGPQGNTLVGQPRPRGFTFPDDVEGYCSFTVGSLLNRLANDVPEDGLIVELGSYKGKSTICLAQSGRKVWAVDHFRGEPLETLDDQKIAKADHITGEYRAEFEANIARYGVADNVRVIESNSHAVKLPTPPVSLLFVDAAHDYESVSADLKAWEPYLTPDGVVVMDDVNFPGVEAVVSEMGQRGWRYVDKALATVALRREI